MNSKAEVHIEETKFEEREIHFEVWGSLKQLAIHRFCTYCGSGKIEQQKEWPSHKCLECGLTFHNSTTEQTYEDFDKYKYNE